MIGVTTEPYMKWPRPKPLELLIWQQFEQFGYPNKNLLVNPLILCPVKWPMKWGGFDPPNPPMLRQLGQQVWMPDFKPGAVRNLGWVGKSMGKAPKSTYRHFFNKPLD